MLGCPGSLPTPEAGHFCWHVEHSLWSSSRSRPLVAGGPAVAICSLQPGKHVGNDWFVGVMGSLAPNGSGCALW